MHEAGVVHCDIKPDNVLLDLVAGQKLLSAVITDFGVARVINTAELQVQAFVASRLNGLSVSYAAPEALNRLRSRLAESSAEIWYCGDVFSTACMLKEMVTRLAVWELGSATTTNGMSVTKV